MSRYRTRAPLPGPLSHRWTALAIDRRELGEPIRIANDPEGLDDGPAAPLLALDEDDAKARIAELVRQKRYGGFLLVPVRVGDLDPKSREIF
jgi:hypothetical protein